MNVLIVDDDQINRKLLRVTLQANNTNTVEAADGVEALKVLEREKVDAIISDILMPNMDGYRLCYEVRRNERFKTIPFIVYTSTYTSPSDEKLALEFGADKYIKKPSPTGAILDALREVTTEAKRQTMNRTPPLKELEVMKAYSEHLVGKLEERNAELLRRTEELRESEEKFRGIFENIQDVFFRTDMLGVIRMISPSIGRYGYRTEELIGNDFRRLCADPADLARLMRTLAEKGSIADLEITLKSKEGTPVIASASSRLLHDLQGRPVGAEGILRDISARKRAEEALRQAHRELEGTVRALERKNQEAEHFIYSISHGLKGPLVSIQGFITEIRRALAGQLGQEGSLYFSRIIANAIQMEHLICDLLDLSQIDRVDTTPEEVNVGDIVKSVLERLDYQIREKRVEVRVQEEPLTVVANRTKIEQVFTNLISNAIAYMGESPNPRIEVHWRDAPEEWLFYVRDNGIGIPKAYHERIFNLFERLPEAKQANPQGRGVGLAIVKGVVEYYGGRIWVESEAGQGAIFYFTLAKRQVESKASEAGGG